MMIDGFGDDLVEFAHLSAWVPTTKYMRMITARVVTTTMLLAISRTKVQ